MTRDAGDRPEVVDGQQRLATTTIMLAAIRDWFFNQGDQSRSSAIGTSYLVERDLRTQEQKARLQLNEDDHDYFMKKILSEPSDGVRNVKPTKESHLRIERAAQLAEQHVNRIVGLSSAPSNLLIDWIDYFKYNVKVIWVTVPSNANAFTIFETLNDRGLDLAVSDLLKNHLFHLSGDRITEAQQKWVSMFGRLDTVGGETVAVDYIRHLWSSSHGATREKDLYEAIRSGVTSKQAAIDFSADLEDGARRYAAIINADNAQWDTYGDTAREHMRTMNLLRMIQIRPLLLAVLAKFSPDNVKKILPAMVSWGVRFLISGGLGGGTLERYYCDRAKEIMFGEVTSAEALFDAMKSIVPSDPQFQAAFANARVSTNYLARYYLRALEKQAKGEEDPELVPNPNKEVVNLEHILPDNPGPAWSNIDDEIAAAYHKRIGNLTLLQARINVEVGNAGFDEKKPYFASSDYKLTSDLADYDNWGPNEIESRQDELSRLAVNTWPNEI